MYNTRWSYTESSFKGSGQAVLFVILGRRLPVTQTALQTHHPAVCALLEVGPVSLLVTCMLLLVVSIK